MQESRETSATTIKSSLSKQVANKEMHKKEQVVLEDGKRQKDNTPNTTIKKQAPAKDQVTEATKVDNKSGQGLVQQWKKKEECLKGVAKDSLSCEKPQIWLPKKPTTTAITYKDKGKAKVESDSPTLCHNLNTQLKEEPATSSSTPTKDETRQMSRQQKKVYQPKYPSKNVQRRMRQVLVPKQMVQDQRLSNGDTHRWVERQASTSQISKGWLSTYKSLEAQGYLLGNRSLWLPKPQSTAYEVSSNPQRRRQSSPRSRKKGGRPRQARQRTNRKAAYGHKKETNKATKTWVPKELLAQISSKGSNKMLVRIQAKRETSEDYKEWVVPHNLITAQGYYEGQAQLWVPKEAINKQEKSPSYHNKHRPQLSNQVNQQRPIKANKSISSYNTGIQSKAQNWMPKETKEPIDKQETKVKHDQKWVPKTSSTQKQQQLSSKSTPTKGMIATTGQEEGKQSISKQAHSFAQLILTFNKFAILRKLEHILASRANQ